MAHDTDFESCLYYTERQYTVPPGNTTRIVITHRHDINHFYVSVQEHCPYEGWVLKGGSAVPTGTDEAKALRVAKRLWGEERAKALKPSQP